RKGKYLKKVPNALKTHGENQKPGHEGGDGQSRHTMLLYDGIDNDNEGAGRSADLNPAPSKDGDDGTGYNGGNKTFIRRDSRGNGKGDGEGKGDHPNDQSRYQILEELLPRYPFPQNGKKLGRKLIVLHVSHGMGAKIEDFCLYSSMGSLSSCGRGFQLIPKPVVQIGVRDRVPLPNDS